MECIVLISKHYYGATVIHCQNAQVQSNWQTYTSNIINLCIVHYLDRQEENWDSPLRKFCKWNAFDNRGTSTMLALITKLQYVKLLRSFGYIFKLYSMWIVCFYWTCKENVKFEHCTLSCMLCVRPEQLFVY